MPTPLTHTPLPAAPLPRHACACLSRRRLLAAAAGAAVLSALPHGAGAGHANVMLLNCMDYRLIDDVGRYMDGRKLTDNYDQIILAGASLGAQPSWGTTFWSHLDLALELHHVHALIVIDHRDCSAYKLLFSLGT